MSRLTWGTGFMKDTRRVRALVAGALVVAACERATDLTRPTRLASRPPSADRGLDSAQLNRLRAVGEGCAVVAADNEGVLRGFAVPRAMLPFSVPAISVNPHTGRGNGRVIRMVLHRDTGKPVTLSCWMPNSVAAPNLTNSIKASARSPHWAELFTNLSFARPLPPTAERPLSPEAAAFKAEMLEDDSVAFGPAMLPPPDAFARNTAPHRETNECDEYEMDIGRRPVRPDDPDAPVIRTGTCACYEWDATIWFDGDSWHISVEFYFCAGGTGDDYGWMITNSYWQWPCGGSTMSPKDSIREQYFDGTLYDSTNFGSTDGAGQVPASQRTGVHWTPGCNELVSSGGGTYFTFPEMKDPTASYAVLKEPMTIDASQQWGLNYWRESYGSARIMNSGYRTPRHNRGLNPPGALGSSHTRGVAADLRNESGTQSEYDAMVAAAGTAQASFIEPTSGPCATNCTHADWRWWVYWPR